MSLKTPGIMPKAVNIVKRFYKKQEQRKKCKVNIIALVLIESNVVKSEKQIASKSTIAEARDDSIVMPSVRRTFVSR